MCGMHDRKVTLLKRIRGWKHRNVALTAFILISTAVCLWTTSLTWLLYSIVSCFHLSVSSFHITVKAAAEGRYGKQLVSKCFPSAAVINSVRLKSSNEQRWRGRGTNTYKSRIIHNSCYDFSTYTDCLLLLL